MNVNKLREWASKGTKVRLDQPKKPTKPAGLLGQEADIVWLDDPTGFPVVYESYQRATHPTEPPPAEPHRGRLIGYAILRLHCRPSTATASQFLRRVWHVERPAENRSILGAIDPASVRMGEYSRVVSLAEKGA